ncbi:MAG: HIT family protein [Candidatus Magasanikbacteria bacterium]|nr:HIT family protein [Candidatus Magasanikbacteria bacterium]
MADCVFCDFVATRRRHSQMVYEDDCVLAILDDNPLAEGHTLVILKSHHPDLTTVSPTDAAEMGRSVARIGGALKAALGAEFIYIASIGEQVRHVHFHLVPRYKGDAAGFGHFLSARTKLQNGQAIAAKIKACLPI